MAFLSALATLHHLKMIMEINRLTNREVEIVKLICEGKSSSEIAEKLATSTETIDVHIKNILKKLELINIHQLIQYGLTMGWH